MKEVCGETIRGMWIWDTHFCTRTKGHKGKHKEITTFE